MLRLSIEEVSGEVTLPVTADVQDSSLRIGNEIIGRGKTKSDS